MSVELSQTLAQPQRHSGMVDPHEQVKVFVVERPIGCRALDVQAEGDIVSFGPGQKNSCRLQRVGPLPILGQEFPKGLFILYGKYDDGLPGVCVGIGQRLSEGASNLLEPKHRLSGRFDAGVGNQREVGTSNLNPFAFGIQKTSGREGHH